MTERTAARHPLLETVETAVAAGVDWVQVRERELSGRLLWAFASDVVRAARAGAERAGGPGGALRILINRRGDLALALGADGLHLGFDAVAPSEARSLLERFRDEASREPLVGVSTHSAAEVEATRGTGADYAHLAPVFDPLSKPATRPSLGIDAVARACEHGLPVLAQGGITVENAGRAIGAGAAGVAVTGTILGATHPGEATRALRATLDGSGDAGRG